MFIVQVKTKFFFSCELFKWLLRHPVYYISLISLKCINRELVKNNWTKYITSMHENYFKLVSDIIIKLDRSKYYF